MMTQQTVVGAVQDAVDFPARFKDGFPGFSVIGKSLSNPAGGSKLFDFFDA